MSQFTIMVTGSRDWTDKRFVWKVLDGIAERERAKDPEVRFTVIHGGASGADRFAGEWANNRGHSEHTVVAQWRRYGRAAGPMRNRQLVQMGPDVVAAFRLDGSRGTSDAIDLAAAAGIETIIEDRVS